MKNSILLTLPSDPSNYLIVSAVIVSLCKKVKFDKCYCDDLRKALEQLMCNATTHAYPDHEGVIRIDISTFNHGIRVGVKDWGVPMAKSKLISAISSETTNTGFDYIRRLVDDFHYKNLGKEGKVFTVIKRTPFPLSTYEPIKKKSSVTKGKNLDIIIREFQEGDEGSIARLVYENYGLSFAKDDFYYPRKILENQGKKVLSIVAESEDEIIGHFALLLVANSNIAEVGVVVVDPNYQGLGVMKKMFTALIDKAEEIGLDAIFGSAVMYHVYSQKSNLSYDFTESALLVGKTLDSIQIAGNKLTEKKERGSTLISYRFFKHRKRSLNLPRRYKERILTCYKHCHIPYELKTEKEKNISSRTLLNYAYDPLGNIGEIIIDKYGEDFKYKFRLLLNHLREKQCDMIYVDINLEQISKVNKIIKILNDRNFFYAGILYLKHNDQDYLRLQSPNSDKIGKSNLVCYSDYCHTLLEYIYHDEESI